MSTINNENLWIKLVSYVFGRMSVQEEKEMDDYLDNHLEAADFADSLLSYCEGEAISDPEMLEAKLKVDRAAYKKIQPAAASTKLPFQKTRTWQPWAIAAAILILIGLFSWPLIFSNKMEFQPGFADFYATEKPLVEEAGADNGPEKWEQHFIKGEFEDMVSEIERMFETTPPERVPRPLFYLCAVYMWQQPPNTDRLKVLLPLTGDSYIDDILKLYLATGIDLDEKDLPIKQQ